MNEACQLKPSPALNSPEWWAGKAKNYLAKKDMRDRPDEFRIMARACRGPVLEVGCAFGVFSKYLPVNEPYVGLDVCSWLVDRAQQAFPMRVFLCGDVMKLRGWDRAFETCVCCQTLEHFHDPKAVIQQIKRICRRRLIFSVPRGEVTQTAHDSDGHLSGWKDEKALSLDWALLGKLTFLEGAKNHICGVLDWTAHKCLEDRGDPTGGK